MARKWGWWCYKLEIRDFMDKIKKAVKDDDDTLLKRTIIDILRMGSYHAREWLQVRLILNSSIPEKYHEEIREYCERAVSHRYSPEEEKNDKGFITLDRRGSLSKGGRPNRTPNDRLLLSNRTWRYVE